MNLKLFWHRVTHWEYWPFELIYYPMFPVWLYFSIRARSFFFFNAANPSMTNGGMTMESKMEIYQKIPKKFIPKTLLSPKAGCIEEVLKQMTMAEIAFPCIVKPDIGMKALGVEKIDAEEALYAYQQKNDQDFLVQEMIPFPKEIGVFFVRIPGEDKGRITGMVSKEFLSVIGDGKSTLWELITKDPRSHLQHRALKKKFGHQLEMILGAGEEFILVPFGSHTRGAKFIDVTDQITPELEEVINEICTQIEGFYYGRLDILYRSFDALSQGKDFSVIEVNGAGSEATHIYDPRHSLFFAWKEITRHWNYLCTISIINHKKGSPYLSYKAGREMLKASNRMEAQLKLI
ncbi:MAG: D-alanine--D-alanine ligase [Bacteroidota bacterium]